MAQLAIKGHATRGEEVIQLLEMLGGKNTFNISNTYPNNFYRISGGDIYGEQMVTNPHSTKTFTLEKFLEKYPYKVGDKVKVWVNGYCGIHTIKEMQWDSIPNEVKYKICNYWYSASNLQPYEEQEKSFKETMEERENSVVVNNEYELKQEGNEHYIVRKDIQYKLSEIDDDKLATEVTCDDFKVVAPDNYLIGKVTKVNGGVIVEYIKKQPQYPKTYEECCKILMGKTNFQDFELVLTKLSAYSSIENSISPEPPHIKLINDFYKLLICRDAYWKIAEDWKPDWCDVCDKYIIYPIYGNKIWRAKGQTINTVLAFLTAEMRDAFYENFKDLIEDCKELL